MAFHELKNSDPGDIDDLLGKVETSFDMHFADNELAHIETFGELCDHIANKIQLINSNECTTQQAFYKIREAISNILKSDKSTIDTKTSLSIIFPKQTRKRQIRELYKELNINLNLLRPHHFFTSILIAALLISLLVIFFDWKFGLSIFGATIIASIISARLGNELGELTVGDIAKQITREHYTLIRRNPNTFNKNEIEGILKDMFAHGLGLDKSELRRDATFI